METSLGNVLRVFYYCKATELTLLAYLKRGPTDLSTGILWKFSRTFPQEFMLNATIEHSVNWSYIHFCKEKFIASRFLCYNSEDSKNNAKIWQFLGSRTKNSTIYLANIAFDQIPVVFSLCIKKVNITEWNRVFRVSTFMTVDGPWFKFS